MAMRLLNSTPAAVNYFSANTPIFRSAGTGSDFTAFGTGYSKAFTTTPDGVDACLITSGTNAQVTMDINIKAVTRTGRMCFLVYFDWFDEGNTSYNNQSCSFRFDNDGSFTAPYLARSVNLHPGWNVVCFGAEISAATTPGYAAWSEGTTGTSVWYSDQYTRFRAVIGGIGSTATRTYFAQLVDSTVFQSRLVLRFDDAYSSVYTVAFPYMQARGLKGVLGVISSKIGTGGYMTWSQVNELLAAGWEIANHTTNHNSNDYTNSSSYWLTEIGDCTTAIQTNCGVTPTTFISPYGNYLRRDAPGYRTAVTQLFDISLGTTDANLGGFLPQGHYLPCHNVRTFSGGVNIAGHIARVNSVIAAGASSILMFHDFGTVTSDLQLTVADFQSIMDEIFRKQSAGMCKVVTMQQFVQEAGGVGFQLVA